MMSGEIALGDIVQWSSNNRLKFGTVIAIVPAGTRPAKELIRHSGKPRDHDSYMVLSSELGHRTVRYWPPASRLEPAAMLTPDEIRWCHKNASRIRAQMARNP
jgi:hypothetical protein